MEVLGVKKMRVLVDGGGICMSMSCNEQSPSISTITHRLTFFRLIQNINKIIYFNAGNQPWKLERSASGRPILGHTLKDPIHPSQILKFIIISFY